MLITALLLLVSNASADGWKEDSSPFKFGADYNTTLKDLPLAAELPADRRPWSGPFWKDRQGSINYNWQTGEKPWQSEIPTKAEVLKMTEEQIKMLPASIKIDIARSNLKNDIAQGNLIFPTYEATKLYSSRPKFLQRVNPLWHSWYGICTGLAQASLHYKNPEPVSISNPDGLMVDFGSGDLKALSAYYYANVAVVEAQTKFEPELRDDRTVTRIGTRCSQTSDSQHNLAADGSRLDGCGRDLNAGALHIVLANRIGFEKQGVIGDFSPGTAINQHPIYGFRTNFYGTRSPSKNAAPGTKMEVRVKTVLEYSYYDAATWDSIDTNEKERTLDYWLELDDTDVKKADIVGGSYIKIGAGKVPDYIWTSEPLAFSHGYEIMNTLLVPQDASSLN